MHTERLRGSLLQSAEAKIDNSGVDETRHSASGKLNTPPTLTVSYTPVPMVECRGTSQAWELLFKTRLTDGLRVVPRNRYEVQTTARPDWKMFLPLPGFRVQSYWKWGSRLLDIGKQLFYILFPGCTVVRYEFELEHIRNLVLCTHDEVGPLAYFAPLWLDNNVYTARQLASQLRIEGCLQAPFRHNVF